MTMREIIDHLRLSQSVYNYFVCWLSDCSSCSSHVTQEEIRKVQMYCYSIWYPCKWFLLGKLPIKPSYKRKQECMVLLSQWLKVKEIATKLWISTQAVYNLKKKFK